MSLPKITFSLEITKYTDEKGQITWFLHMGGFMYPICEEIAHRVLSAGAEEKK